MSEPLVERARGLLATRLGFTPDCVRAEKVTQALAALCAQGLSTEAVFEGLSRGEPRVAQAFEDAAVVSETFFFRELGHFELVLSTVLPAFLASGRPVLRVWSAGCASGEEAWSLAALLLPQLEARQRQLSVLGTDVSTRNIQLAKAGVYGAWSERPSAPFPVPLFAPGAPQPRAVREGLRTVTSFEVGNLLAPAPQLTGFDVIFCRNVLVYFEPKVASSVAAELLTRLSPEGLAAFGPMDLRSPPRDAQPVGPVELNAWRRPLPVPQAPRRQPAPLKLSFPRSTPLVAPALDGAVVPLHLRALALLEDERWSEALSMLEEASGLSPDYLPALLERALIHERRGDRFAARGLMRTLLTRAQGVEGVVSGPEALPAEYYRSTAEIYLARVEGNP